MLLVSSEMVARALQLTGVFAVGLGIVHVVIPLIMDFDHAIPTSQTLPTSLHAIGIGALRYEIRRSDVRGVAWVMSNAASYVLVTLGVADLAAPVWIGTDAGRLLTVWAVGWWAIRAAGQLIVGRRGGDVLIAGWFGGLALINVAAALM